MPPRSRFFPRPHDSLKAAAAKHAAIAAGEPHPDDPAAPSAGGEQTQTETRRRRRQAHDSKGRFT